MIESLQSFTVKLSDNMKAKSFNDGQVLYINPMKLLPLDRFLPQPKGARGAARGGRGGQLSPLTIHDVSKLQALEVHLVIAAAVAVDAVVEVDLVIAAAVAVDAADSAIVAAHVSDTVLSLRVMCVCLRRGWIWRSRGRSRRIR